MPVTSNVTRSGLTSSRFVYSSNTFFIEIFFQAPHLNHTSPYKSTFVLTEYMYQVLVRNNCTIPVEGLYMVRYHSFYPWHSSDDFDYLCSDKDRSLLKWVRMFK